jgi:(4S)-4-hydroxy-5-phosphonooxypentane-2,3-dione isomerase
MPKVALLSRFKSKQGKAEELIAAFRPVFEQVPRSRARCSTSCTGPRTNPRPILYLRAVRRDDACAVHRGSDAMAAATTVLGELIAGADHRRADVNEG